MTQVNMKGKKNHKFSKFHQEGWRSCQDLFVFMYREVWWDWLVCFPTTTFLQANTYVYQKLYAVYFVSPLCVYSILKDKIIGYLYVRMLKIMTALFAEGRKTNEVKCTSFHKLKKSLWCIFLMKFRINLLQLYN